MTQHDEKIDSVTDAILGEVCPACDGVGCCPCATCREEKARFERGESKMAPMLCTICKGKGQVGARWCERRDMGRDMERRGGKNA